MLMFKIFNSAFPHFVDVNFCKLSNMSVHSTRQLEFNFYVKPVKLKSTQCFILHNGVKIWNNLPV